MSKGLDALCDLLDESDEDEQAETGDAQAHTASAAATAAAAPEEEQIMEDVDCVNEEDEDEEKEVEVESMEAQLKAMQEQMRKMQQMLEDKKKKQQMAKKKAPPTVSEVDLFSRQSTSSSSSNAPRSPVKTNPFEESDRPRKQAKTFLKTPDFGPALPGKTTRVITGEEKKKLLDQLGSREREKMAAIVRDDLADSSDEEVQRNPMEERYNSFGKDVKRIAKAHSVPLASTSKDGNAGQITAIASKEKIGFNQIKGATLNISNQRKNSLLPKDLMVERFSRLKVSRPLVDAQVIEVHMFGKTFVPICKLREGIRRNEVQGDWTTIGVMYYKSSQTSKNGNTYTLWKMTDLVGDIKTVIVLLFGKSHNAHYKMPLNKVVGILNAKVLEERSGTVTLSVDHPDKILEIGDSLEAGKCVAKKPDGSGCTNLVNLSSCEYCAFHVKKAYNAISSKRGDLQSSFSGGGVGTRARIMNKIDPKGSYFAGGQSVNSFGDSMFAEPPVPARLSDEHRRREAQRLTSLGVAPVDKILRAEERQRDALAIFHQDGKVKFRTHLSNVEKEAVKEVAHGVSAELGLRLLAPTPGARGLIKTLTRNAKSMDDSEKLRLLDSSSSSSSATDPSTVGNTKNNMSASKKMIFEHKKRLAEERARKVLVERQAREVPMLGRGIKGSGDMIDLLSPSRKTLSLDASKAKALLALKGKTIEKSSANYVPVKKRKAENGEDEGQDRRKKKMMILARALNEESSTVEVQKEGEGEAVRVASCGEVLTKERLEKIRNSRSRNENLVEDFENEQLDRRMDDLEKKEAMEEKMVSTKEIETRAVSCKICVYTAFSQSDLCRDSGHRVKVLRIKKRFFECAGCKRRTECLDKYPKSACSNCAGSTWRRTGMMRERKGPTLESERLLIRGEEQKFVGQAVAGVAMASLDSLL